MFRKCRKMLNVVRFQLDTEWWENGFLVQIKPAHAMVDLVDGHGGHFHSGNERSCVA